MVDDWMQLDSLHVWHPFTQHQNADEPLPIVRAKGSLLFDAQGKSYIDANSSWWVNVHGHGHPVLAAALQRQFETLDHVVFAGVTHPKAVELATRIANSLPDPLSRVFFSDNGSTSVEVALKMAFQFYFNRGESRTKVLALEGAYHGDTFGAMSVGQRAYFNEPFEHLFFEADYLEIPVESSDAASLEKASSLLSSGEFAALIVEPLVQGAAGMRMYEPAWLNALMRLARENQVLIIFDEVMTGFGRTGKMYALNHLHEVPDIVCLSKGLTGGVLPLGLTVATGDIFNAFLAPETTKALLHGHSFTANALTCALSCASLDLFEEERTWTNIQQIENWHREFGEILQQRDDIFGIGQCGTILRFEIAQEEGASYFSKLRDTVYRSLLAQGVLLRPLGNVLFVNPPYCLTRDEYMKLRSAILHTLDSLKKSQD